MAVSAKRTLSDEPNQADVELLEATLRVINRDRFAEEDSIPARWGIPSAVEPKDPSEEIKLLPPEDQEIVAQAMQAYAERNFENAKEVLKPVMGYEIRAIVGLYTSIIRHLKEEIWFNTSQAIWIKGSDALAPAAASTEVRNDEEVILVHPALSSKGLKAPRYVLYYVLYHERLHKALNTSAFNPHPELFRRLEKLCPKRESAVQWLKKHRFSTIEDKLPCA